MSTPHNWARPTGSNAAAPLPPGFSCIDCGYWIDDHTMFNVTSANWTDPMKNCPGKTNPLPPWTLAGPSIPLPPISKSVSGTGTRAVVYLNGKEIGQIKDTNYEYGKNWNPKCECGARSCGVADYKKGHSAWCPVAESD